MSVVADVVAQFRGDSSDLESAASRSTDALAQMEGATTRGSSALNTLGREAGTAATIVTGGFVAATAIAVNTTRDWVNMVEQAQVGFTALAGGSRAAGEAMAKGAEDFAIGMGQNVGATLNAQKALEIYTQGVHTSTKDLSVFADTAAGTGQSIDGVTSTVSRFYDMLQRMGTGGGQSGARAQMLYGLGLSPEQLNQISQSLSSGVSPDQIWATLQKDLESRWQGAGQDYAQNTMKGLMTSFHGAFDQIIGTAFLPIEKAVEGVVAKVNDEMKTPGFQRFVAELTSFAKEAASAIESLIPKMDSLFSHLTAANVDKFVADAKQIAPALGAVAGVMAGLSIDKLGGLPIIGGIFRDLGAVLSPVTAGFLGFLLANNQTREALMNLIGAVGDLLKNLLGLGGAAAGLASGLAPLAATVINIVAAVVKWIATTGPMMDLVKLVLEAYAAYKLVGLVISVWEKATTALKETVVGHQANASAATEDQTAEQRLTAQLVELSGAATDAAVAMERLAVAQGTAAGTAGIDVGAPLAASIGTGVKTGPSLLEQGAVASTPSLMERFGATGAGGFLSKLGGGSLGVGLGVVGAGAVGFGATEASKAFIPGSRPSDALSAGGTVAEYGVAGAVIGSVIPGLGTAMGALAGTTYGLITSFNKVNDAANAAADKLALPQAMAVGQGTNANLATSTTAGELVTNAKADWQKIAGEQIPEVAGKGLLRGGGFDWNPLDMQLTKPKYHVAPKTAAADAKFQAADIASQNTGQNILAVEGAAKLSDTPQSMSQISDMAQKMGIDLTNSKADMSQLVDQIVQLNSASQMTVGGLTKTIQVLNEISTFGDTIAGKFGNKTWQPGSFGDTTQSDTQSKLRGLANASPADFASSAPGTTPGQAEQAKQEASALLAKGDALAKNVQYSDQYISEQQSLISANQAVRNSALGVQQADLGLLQAVQQVTDATQGLVNAKFAVVQAAFAETQANNTLHNSIIEQSDDLSYLHHLMSGGLPFDYSDLTSKLQQLTGASAAYAQTVLAEVAALQQEQQVVEKLQDQQTILQGTIQSLSASTDILSQELQAPLQGLPEYERLNQLLQDVTASLSAQMDQYKLAHPFTSSSDPYLQYLQAQANVAQTQASLVKNTIGQNLSDQQLLIKQAQQLPEQPMASMLGWAKATGEAKVAEQGLAIQNDLITAQLAPLNAAYSVQQKDVSAVVGVLTTLNGLTTQVTANSLAATGAANSLATAQNSAKDAALALSGAELGVQQALNNQKNAADAVATAQLNLHSVNNRLYSDWLSDASALLAKYQATADAASGVTSAQKQAEMDAQNYGRAWIGVYNGAIHAGFDQVVSENVANAAAARVAGIQAGDMGYSMHASGSFEDHNAQIASSGQGTRVWNEPETWGEAYIPLSPAKRFDAMNVLGQVMKEFGVAAPMSPLSHMKEAANGGFSGLAAQVIANSNTYTGLRPQQDVMAGILNGGGGLDATPMPPNPSSTSTTSSTTISSGAVQVTVNIDGNAPSGLAEEITQTVEEALQRVVMGIAVRGGGR